MYILENYVLSISSITVRKRCIDLTGAAYRVFAIGCVGGN